MYMYRLNFTNIKTIKCDGGLVMGKGRACARDSSALCSNDESSHFRGDCYATEPSCLSTSILCSKIA